MRTGFDVLIRSAGPRRAVEVSREEYPCFEEGFPLRMFYEDTDPFHFPGGYSGVMTRISAAEITNMAQGGSIIPTFVLDPR